MKVAIIGMGFVGKALRYSLKDNLMLYEVDPKIDTKVADLETFKPKIIFICVPTPMKENGGQDLNIIKSVFHEIKKLKISPIVVVKSTVTPDNLVELNKQLDFVYNPEFLREKNANEDIIKNSLIIFGGEECSVKKVSNFYHEHTNCERKEHFFTDLVSASLIKYTINSFLANKVIFFNQLKDIFDLSGTNEDWSNFIEILSQDKRIGKSHMNVPGHDGRKGYGGACFPKDTAALLKFSKNLGKEFTLLRESIIINNRIRSVYNGPIKREAEQNISFEKKDD